MFADEVLVNVTDTTLETVCSLVKEWPARTGAPSARLAQ